MNTFEEYSPEDRERLQALVDNTAQGIYNYLKEVENKREIYERRWIWELLQNALDAAPEEGKVDIEITVDNNQLAFKHNGRPFRGDEVAHLVHYGSTKKEHEVGKFGTGFLTTHLLSKKVSVVGVREDGKKFGFTLDRDGHSFEEIKELMEKTWSEYKNSLTGNGEILPHLQFSAEYTYPLDSSVANIVKAGIEELVQIAPYVLAFNQMLGSIKINFQDEQLSFKKESESKLDSQITFITIRKEKENTAGSHTICVIGNEDVEVAIPTKRLESGNYQVEYDQISIPKIFLAFPLLGTRDLPFPVVVNSRKFEPTDKRDGIFLGKGENSEDVKRNKTLLEMACDLFIRLVEHPTMEGRWDNFCSVLQVGLGLPPDKDWLDREWYINLLRERILNQIEGRRILKTVTGPSISPKEASIPFLEPIEKEEIEKLWGLLSLLTTHKDKIPSKTDAIEWAKIILKWADLFEKAPHTLDNVTTMEKLAQEIADYGNLERFKSQLTTESNALDWLNDFFKLLLEAKKSSLLDSNILPNQNGIFRQRSELFRDDGIHDTLKDISKNLGNDVRDKLLHLVMNEDVKNLLSPKSQNEVLNQIISTIKQPRPDDTQYLHCNLELFKWFVENKRFELLNGYPVLSCREKTFTSLGEGKLLVPKEVWNARAKDYADLLPQEFIFSSLYFERIPLKERWEELTTNGLVMVDPLYRDKQKLSGEDIDVLLPSSEKLEEENEHETTEDIEVSKIAFISEIKDKRIIDTVRNSKEKARKFLDFLFEYVVEADSQWDNPIMVDCKCGVKHKVFPAFWISPLKTYAWVPIHKGKSETPSSQNLALLLEGHGQLLRQCKEDKPSKLLSILNVSVSELMMHIVAKDVEIKLELDRAMGSLWGTFMANPQQLTKIAQLAESGPDIFIEEVEKQIQNREKIRRNQLIGSIVQDLLKNVLEKEGFHVEPTGVGSDYLIEYDLVENNLETIFKIRKEGKPCFLLEIKSTSQEFVRMTITQAKEACAKSDEYVLCVIRLGYPDVTEEYVESAVRFVPDIGMKIKEKVSKAELLQKEHIETIAEAGDIEIEIDGGPIRFKINEKVWEDGKTFEEFLEFLRSTAV